MARLHEDAQFLKALQEVSTIGIASPELPLA
jgi:hypothetical protein